MTTQSPRGAALVLVLDNEPAQALADAGHPGHQLLLAYVDAVSGRNRRRPGTAAIVVPTSVRVEALLSRRSPRASELGRLRVRDVELTQRRADRCADLRRAAGGSATDATVAQAAEVAPSRGHR